MITVCTGRVAGLLLAMAVAVHADPDISNWIKELGSEDAQKRDHAQEQILSAGVPALAQVDRALESANEAETIARLKAIRELLQRESHLLAQSDAWFRHTKKSAWRRMQSEIGERDGRKAWHFTDTFVEREAAGLGTQVWEAWVDYSGSRAPIFLRWTVHGVMEGLRVEALDIEFRFERGVMKIKTAKLECDNEEVKRDLAQLYNRDVSFTGPLVWIHAIPRLAVLLPTGAAAPPNAMRLQLPEDIPIKKLGWTWVEAEKIQVGGKDVQVRKFHGNAVDESGRLVRISDHGEWDRVDEATARAGVDDGK